MFLKKSKGGAVAAFLMPYIVIAAFAVLILGFLTIMIVSFSIVYNDNQANVATLLPAILDSGACTPNTQVPFKDVLAIGIATGKTGLSDTIAVDYGGASEDSAAGSGLNVGTCLKRISNSLNLPFACEAETGFDCGEEYRRFKYNFYVKYFDCPSGKCTVKTAYTRVNIPQSGNIIETANIALPDGGLATVFLER
ncbi:Uncharacterised protein [uncultured archaeon]|nr:Uncharacterised protein [uncultured archaeon]